MKLTIAQLMVWYDEFREVVFNGHVPPSWQINFVITHTYHMLGYFQPRNGNITIKISDYYLVSETEYRNTLLHEMCHAWCYCNGFRREGHGPNWKKIARVATKITGLEITRCNSRRGFEVNPLYQKKQDKRMERKFGVYPIVVLDYGDHKFCVKTTKSVLCKASDHSGNKLNVSVRCQDYNIFISEVFTNWSCSKSLGRGYRFTNEEFEKKIVPIMEKSFSTKDPAEIFRPSGQYYDLVIGSI